MDTRGAICHDATGLMVPCQNVGYRADAVYDGHAGRVACRLGLGTVQEMCRLFLGWVRCILWVGCLGV